MKNIYIYFIITIIITVLSSCATQEPLIQKKVPKEEIVQNIISTPVINEKDVEKPSTTLNEVEIKEAETDISELIMELNEIIASKNFNNWKNHLSVDYIEHYSNPDVLKEKSQSPLLTKYKVVLRTLEDYFNYVVVGSRQNIKLDEIKALDRDRIKAYMFINNKAVIIYELIRIDDSWKIGKFLE